MAELIQSRPYTQVTACEACVFGSGEHKVFCDLYDQHITPPSPENLSDTRVS